MTSDWKRKANQHNAQKSTGPTTEQGKATSRQNATIHGLAGAGIVLTALDTDLVAQRKITWRKGYRLTSQDDEWHFEQLVIHSVRLDRCVAMEQEIQIGLAHRAQECWDVDHEHDVAQVATRLSRAPSLTVATLRTSLHGCRWLLARWKGLLEALDTAGTWNDDQRSLALDLLGTPPELRNLSPALAVEPGDAKARAIVTGAIANLDDLAERSMGPIDASERAMAERGCPIAMPRVLILLRRYEAAFLRQFERSRKRLVHLDAPASAGEPEESHHARPAPEREPDTTSVRVPAHGPEPDPESVAEPESAKPESLPQPPACVDPVREPVTVDLPIPATRGYVSVLPTPARLIDAMPGFNRPLTRRQRKALHKQMRRNT